MTDKNKAPSEPAISQALFDTCEVEAKADNFSSTEAYILHILEKQRLIDSVRNIEGIV